MSVDAWEKMNGMLCFIVSIECSASLQQVTTLAQPLTQHPNTVPLVHLDLTITGIFDRVRGNMSITESSRNFQFVFPVVRILSAWWHCQSTSSDLYSQYRYIQTCVYMGIVK